MIILPLFLFTTWLIPVSDALCTPEIEGLQVETCLDSFNKQFEAIKKAKPQLELIVAPFLFMEKNELSLVCAQYKHAKENCSALLQTCDQHKVVKFAVSNFEYVCNADSDYRKQSECLVQTIQRNQQCVMTLKKVEGANDCKAVSGFYKCMEPWMQLSCGAKGQAALVHALGSFGCDTYLLDEDKRISECDQSDEQTVTACFSPLTRFWTQIRLNDTTLDNVAYPLFHFRGADVVRMCELINQVKDDCPQLIRCPTHPIPSFTNGLLALPCGPQQSLFFLSFDCIRNTIKENEQCTQLMPGLWSPGKIKDSCWQVPAFFECIKDKIQAKCSAEGMNAFAQSLKQFGCNVELTNWNGNWAALPPGIPHDLRNLSAPQPTGDQIVKLGFAAVGEVPLQTEPLPESFRPEPPRPPPPANLSSAFQSSGPPGLRQPPGVVPSVSAVTPASLVPPASGLNAAALQPQKLGAPAPVPRPQLLPDGTDLASLLASPGQQLSNQAPVPAAGGQPAAPPANSAGSPASQQQIIPTVKPLSTVAGAEATVTVQVPVGLQGAFGDRAQPVDMCSKVRTCLQPLFTKWVQIQNNRNLSNLTFPTFHYEKQELMDMCDTYAAAFVNCNHSMFSGCLQDEIVFLANSVFGYLCSPQNVVSFIQNFECIVLTVRNRPICDRPITGQLVMGKDLGTRCQGIHDFYVCNRLPIDRACGSEALKHVQETIKQFGCILDP